MTYVHNGPRLSSLYWLPLVDRSRALAEIGIRVTWYVRPASGLYSGLPHVRIGARGVCT